MYEEHGLVFRIKGIPPPRTDGDKGGDISGFEFAFLIVAIAIILFKRRNNKNN